MPNIAPHSIPEVSSAPYSPEFMEILKFCNTLSVPITTHDVHALTAIYRALKQGLAPKERSLVGKILQLMQLRTSPSVWPDSAVERQ